MGQAPGADDGEDLEPIVRRVDGEEMATIGRQRERSHLTALELDEPRRLGRRRRGEEEGGSQSPAGHLAGGTSRADGLTITSSPADNNVFTRGSMRAFEHAAADRPRGPDARRRGALAPLPTGTG